MRPAWPGPGRGAESSERPRPSSLLVAEAGAAGEDDGLGAVGDVELGEDDGHVVAHRLRAEVELAGDRPVVVAVGDQPEHLDLTLGESGERPVGEAPSRLGRRDHCRDQVAIDHDVPGGGHPHRMLEPLRPGPLHEVAGRPVAQRRAHGVAVVGHRQHDHPDLAVFGVQPPVDLEPRAVAEPHVEQHHVGRCRRDERRHGVRRLRLADQLDADHVGDGDRQPHPEHRVVVDDGDAQRRAGSGHDGTTGSSTWRWVPCGRIDRTSTHPPSSAARSRIASSPMPGERAWPSVPTPSSTTSIPTV